MAHDKIQYITRNGFAELQKEFEELKNKKIPDIASRIDEAKQQGDLSENAEYHQAKEEMAWAQGRFQEVRYILDHAEIVEATPENKDTISVGSTVVVKTNSATKIYTIVGPHEADPLNKKISNESPLGESFLGHKIGDKIVVNTPVGKQTYEILEINPPLH